MPLDVAKLGHLVKGQGIVQDIDIIIVHGLLVTMDNQGTVTEDGAIAISGSDILALGRSSELIQRFHAKEVIDASHHIVMPGLIRHPTSDFIFLTGDRIIFTERQNVKIILSLLPVMGKN